MNREAVAALLRKAVGHTIYVARGMVTDELPEQTLFSIMAEQSRSEPELLSEGEVLDIIWSPDGIMRWADLSVCGTDGTHTHIALDGSTDRVRTLSETVYHSRGMGPFGIKSPTLPPGWKSVEESGRFRIRNENKS